MKAIEIGMNYTIPILRSLDISGEPVGGLRDTIRTFSRLGLPYRMIGRSDTAIIIYHNYIRAGKENNFEPLDLMLHTGLLAMCYHEIGEDDSALYYYREAAAYPDLNTGILAMKHTHMLRMAGIFLTMGIPDSAIYNQAVILYGNLYRFYLERNEIRTAMDYLVAFSAWQAITFHASRSLSAISSTAPCMKW